MILQKMPPVSWELDTGKTSRKACLDAPSISSRVCGDESTKVSVLFKLGNLLLAVAASVRPIAPIVSKHGFATIGQANLRYKRQFLAVCRSLFYDCEH